MPYDERQLVREIEVKYRVDDLEGVLTALKSRGIEVSDPVHQDDQAYAPDGWQFGDSKIGVSFLRLRTVAGRHYFTLKQPVDNDQACLEYETEVTDREPMHHVALHMGYRPTSELQLRFQLRVQLEQARLSEVPLWVIKAAGQSADPSVTAAVEARGGGVIYTADNGKTFTDAQGNPLQVTLDKATDQLTVKGYQAQYGPAATASGSGNVGSAQSPDASAPPGPVSPAVAEGTAPAAPAAPEEPELPGLPDDPEIVP